MKDQKAARRSGIEKQFTCKLLVLTLAFVLFVLMTCEIALMQSAVVDYYHMPGCQDCLKTDPMMISLEHNYSNTDFNITFNWVDVSSLEGLRQWQQYGFVEVPAIVVNNETKLAKEEITPENVSMAIDDALSGKKTDSNYTNMYNDIPLAYSMGVFSGFSPCLMAILGFILAYTAGTSNGMRDGMSRAIVFGTGLIVAYVVIGMVILILGKSLLGMEVMSIVAGLIAILIGISLLGLLKVPFTLNDYFKNSVKKYSGSWIGLFALGIVFSMVKVPCATPFLLILINEMLRVNMFSGFLLLLVFGLGVLTPFTIIGFVGGFALSKKVQSYRMYIKTLSGAIMIIMGLWISYTTMVS